MIKYDKTFELFKKKHITTYQIRKENIIPQGVYTKMKHGGNIDMRSINKLCAVLNCQPGDLIEYVPDESPKTVN